ncbi:MAG: phosphoribosyltransferase [Cyanobacteriota bacterium]|nr:phosphoribosyltransferase [Cyanobacteriota bacterium]
MNDLYISWSEYHQKIEFLAAKIYRSQWQFDSIVCLARGGMRVGDILSRIFDRPLAVLATSAYGGPTGQVRGKIKLANNLTVAVESLGDKVLLVDDLVDSGISLKESHIWLQERYPSEIKQLKTAVIWYKEASFIKPDYYVDRLLDNPWIHQPFEVYDRKNPADLLLPDDEPPTIINY